MKATFLLFFLSISAFCQESNLETLKKTIDKLDNINSVLYESKLQAVESGTTYLEDRGVIYFDFQNPTSPPKYFIKTNDSELIYNGKSHIQSLEKDKLIITNNNPNVNNPLLLTLLPLKRILPKLIDSGTVDISKKGDKTIGGIPSFVFEFTITGGYIDWEKLDLKIITGSKNKNRYELAIDKANYLPVMWTMGNGPSGTMSRTFEKWDFNRKVGPHFWTGDHLPSEYETITFNEYYNRMKSKLVSVKKTDSPDITHWKIPNLEDNSIVDFSKLKGKVVMLEFWFKFCGPCVKAVPELNKIHTRYKNQAFQLMGIEFREDFPQQNLLEYVRKLNMGYPTLYKGGEMSKALGVTSAPTFIIINKDGKIVYSKSGFDEDQIIKTIEEHL